MPKFPSSRIGSQAILDLKIDKNAEIDGVPMGVLTDGTPYLTGRGVARLCGVNNARIVELGADWDAETRDITKKVKSILRDRGTLPLNPYYEVSGSGGVTHAYPDTVSLAVLEAYAFDADIKDNSIALRNFRLLAGEALRKLIYQSVGFDPNNFVPAVWRQFHDRMSKVHNAVPTGFFGVFKEIADMVVTLGQAGLHIDEKFVPDISVGQVWSKHWVKTGGDDSFGERDKFLHEYPDYFPQAAAGPKSAWCYPESALGEFRRWFREDYVGEGAFGRYITKKVKDKALPPSFSELAIEVMQPDS